MNKNFSNQRSEPRIPVKPLHRVAFVWMKDGQFHSLEISNISRKGIGFYREGSQELPEKGVIVGRLTVGGQEFEIQPEIVFSNQRAVGCRLTDSRPEIDQAIENYFSAELSALHLSEEKESRYACSAGQDLKVWVGGNHCEVLLVTAGDKIIRFKVSVFGNVFDGGDERALSVGEVIRGDDFDDFSSDGRVVLTRPIVELDASTREAALRFVDCIEAMDQVLRQKISKMISDFPASA